MIKIVRAKLHGLRVTGADISYHGSITLDPEHCAEAGIYPLEFVNVWNKSNGQRLETYVVYGEPGSRCCILNGAAARLCHEGDEVIIAATELIEPEELCAKRPRVLTFTPDNRIADVLQYRVEEGKKLPYDFFIDKLN